MSAAIVSPPRPPGQPPTSKGRRAQSKAVADATQSRDPQAGVSDVTQLLTLTEESVMQNTMVRFARDEIYTFVGSVLLAVNPYKPIASLYGEAAMEAFERITLFDAPPHVYALVEGAYRKAVNGGGNQSLIISGESGAGKTESTKHALSYLVWRTRRSAMTAAAADGASAAGGNGGAAASGARLTTSIIQANPLMEAFGNACTSRNSNSSRFGKCVRLALDPSRGGLLGGQVETYLLEKSRVTTGMSDHFGSGARRARTSCGAFHRPLMASRSPPTSLSLVSPRCELGSHAFSPSPELRPSPPCPSSRRAQLPRLLSAARGRGRRARQPE